ncbi:hypothetical protein [Lichenicoccus sp.]|uniref:hypothetical protein n=1 Tax=Lichenicoccus sp. TaxID=2781899 RepID=UPI003D0E5A1E
MRFATFWKGALSPMEAACLLSYTKRGYPLTLFSHATVDVPEGVILRDAGEIVDESYTRRFIYDGKPNLSHFTDYFRYNLFKKTDQIWVDADMVLLRSFSEVLPPLVLAKERRSSVCGAIMRLPRGAKLDLLIERAEAAMDRNLIWGETGPILLTKVFGRGLMNEAYSPGRFFAIPHDDFWKAFLPEYANECAAVTEDAWGLHLWNNIVDRLGIWKKHAPPVGSFLHVHFQSDGVLELFDEPYPVAIMRQMIENFRLRKSGGDLGIKGLLKQAVPSVERTIRHYKK